MDRTALGDRMKMFEGVESGRRLMPLLPVCARLDGKCFSRFTKGLSKPYDTWLSTCMEKTTQALMEETIALLGYTQSDEINLFWYSDDIKSQSYFDGRIQKIVGELAALAALIFNEEVANFLRWKVGQRARFDARVWNVPTLSEAANTFLWRERDATRNSVSAAASAHFSHQELQGKSGAEKQDMLHDKGVNWNDYPADFKRGTFYQRVEVVRPFTAEELDKLPPRHEARHNPGLLVMRHEVRRMDMPPFGTVTNRVDVLMGADPISEQGESDV